MLPESTSYLSCAQTARLVRTALKEAFPGVRFSVRSKQYSGGASIRVTWSDGPTNAQVQHITTRFEGSSFDPIQDLKMYTTETRMAQDGTVHHIHYGADHIFPQRTVTQYDEHLATAIAMIRQRCRCSGEPPHDQFGGQWVEDLAHRMVHSLDFRVTDAMEQSFRHVVMA